MISSPSPNRPDLAYLARRFANMIAEDDWEQAGVHAAAYFEHAEGGFVPFDWTHPKPDDAEQCRVLARNGRRCRGRCIPGELTCYVHVPRPTKRTDADA